MTNPLFRLAPDELNEYEVLHKRAQEAWNEARDEINNLVAFASDRVDLWEQELDKRSAMWQKGPKGQAIARFIDGWRDLADMEVEDLLPKPPSHIL